ncbi:smc protein, putative [Theileria annulata]|uniref:Structural maintenance of chromosomes protein n=1 Tax=Theileria annulata TaxID=5874 RepID=Q4UDH7_THEAN|nr:smc protein, putative [Theileria annulata]CAI74862.1 smc protein, putative [Theileria annulata]|eukprot:XP_952594.1 smc protein, putative [Theileria annulata]
MDESPSQTTQTKSSPNPLKFKEHVRTIGAEFRETEGPIRRLIIHKVVLNNFKSYGGVTTIGPFHKRFTSIVGPNGSGKSNVIDAMLFVFGFRAKQIRFDKLSELIHNSKYYLNKNNGKPLQSMKVSIHFIEILDYDPDVDDYEVIEGSEMVISREVSSDNTSKYRLNGTVCTQKQISNALKSFGMDLYNNRFLILQGEVEQISQMKPKATKPDEEGLLEYLEDIIGTNQYLEQINQALEKYEELQEQYQIHFNRTMVTQNEIQDMLQGKEEAEEYLSKENLYHKYNYMLTKHELMDLQTDMDKLTEELNSIKGELKSHNEGISTVVDQKNEISKNLKKLETEINKFSTKHREYGEEFKKLCNRDEDLRMQLLHEVKKVEEKTKLIKTLTSKIPELEKQSKNKLEESDQLKKKIPNLEQELERAEKEFDEVRKSLASESEKLMQNLQLYEKNLAPVQEKYDKVKNELESIETNLQLIEKTTEEEETRKLTLETDFSSTQITLQANKDNLKNISEKINECSQKLQRIMTDLSSLENKITETNSKLINTKVSYESKRNEAGQNKFHNTIHDFVKKLSKTNKGIYGTFGDLVRVEDKFEKSFLAICGPFLEFFVVENPEVGTRIFTQLRQNNLGKVSCIALSVISTNPNTDSGQQYGKYGYLSKYVFPNQKDENYEKIVKCINYYTRDVLVVQNLDEADEVSRKTNKRVVTIEGEVIEKDGRITGGGLEKTLKKFKQSKKGPSSEQSDDINAIFHKMESYEMELKALKERHSGLSMEKDKNELHLRELNFTLDATKRKISSDESYLKDLESSLKSLKSTIQDQDNENQIKQLKKSLRETQNRKESTYEELVKKQNEVDKCLKELENVGGGSLTASKSKVSACEKNLSKLRKQIEDSREQYAVLAGESQKYSRDLTRLDSDIQQHKTREKNLENQLDQLEEEASKINECLIEVNNKLNELKSSHNELTESMKKMAAQIKEHDILVIDLRHKQENCEKSLSLLKNTQKQKNEKMNESKKLFYNSLKSLKTSTRSTELYISTMKLDTLSIHSNRCSKTDDDLVPKDSNLNHSESSELNGQTELNDLNRTTESSELNGEAELNGVNGINGISEGKDLVKNEKVDDIEDLIEDVGVLNKKVQSLKVQLNTVPNLSIIDSFVEKVNDFSNKKKNLLDIQNQRDEAKLLHENLSFKRKSEFLFNFEIIANKLKEIYQMITLGGDAELELVDSTEPFTEGVLFSVRPVKKSWKQIYNLSGGEKTLSSLALVFALHHYKPNPVYFMDEIDAALDFRNVSIIAQSIKERTKDAQFIIISLRNQMFEMCNKMVGIYKTFDVTKSIAINPQTLTNQYTEENSQS